MKVILPNALNLMGAAKPLPPWGGAQPLAKELEGGAAHPLGHRSGSIVGRAKPVLRRQRSLLIVGGGEAAP